MAVATFFVNVTGRVYDVTSIFEIIKLILYGSRYISGVTKHYGTIEGKLQITLHIPCIHTYTHTYVHMCKASNKNYF